MNNYYTDKYYIDENGNVHKKNNDDYIVENTPDICTTEEFLNACKELGLEESDENEELGELF